MIPTLGCHCVLEDESQLENSFVQLKNHRKILEWPCNEGVKKGRGHFAGLPAAGKIERQLDETLVNLEGKLVFYLYHLFQSSMLVNAPHFQQLAKKD